MKGGVTDEVVQPTSASPPVGRTAAGKMASQQTWPSFWWVLPYARELRMGRPESRRQDIQLRASGEYHRGKLIPRLSSEQQN